MNKKSIAIFSTLLFIAAVVNLVSNSHLRVARGVLRTTYKAPQSALSPALINTIAGEFKGLWANYMLLEVASFEGSQQEKSPEDYINIYRGLKQALILDPYFQHTYMLAQGTLPWRAKMYDEANELLEISRKHRAWDWRPGYYKGFNYYFFLNDFSKASKVLLESANIRGAPILLAFLGARFAQRVQQTTAAIELLSRMLEDDNLPDAHRADLIERLSALNGILQLEKAIDRFQEKNGFFPPSLEAIVQYGLLDELPDNPYGDTFKYNSFNGRVAFDDVEN